MNTDLAKYKKAVAAQRANKLKVRLEVMSYKDICSEIALLRATFDEHILPKWAPYEEMLKDTNAEEMLNSMDEEEQKIFDRYSAAAVYHAVLLMVYDTYRKKHLDKPTLTIVK